MSTACVFCEIVDGRAPATVEMVTPDSVVIVPRNPVTPGHRLVIPRRHVVDAFDQPGITSITMRDACQWAERIGQCNLITSVGPAATQTVFHLHIHVVPRRVGDGLALPWTGQGEGRS